jgi:hypothetical protein
MSQPSFDPVSSVASEVAAAATSSAKRPLNIYTLMVLISFICMAAGTILLLIELSNWGTFSDLPWKTDSATPKLTAN